MQGESRGHTVGISASLAFAAAFMAGAVSIFALVYFLGVLLQVAGLLGEWRLGLAAGGFLVLAAVDLLGIKKSTYCPIGRRRQTPRSLMRRYSVSLVVAAWGLDAGLAVTTFRVAAITWAALVLAGLGLSAWWAGIGYGLGFVVPFLVLIWTHRVGRASKGPTPADPGLESMLARRPLIQGVSAALLILMGGVLTAGLVI